MVKELTLRQRRERGLRAAEVVVQASEMAGQISPDMEFAAINSGKVRETFGPVEGEAGGLTGSEQPGIVRHKRSEIVTMYKPDMYGHYTPRRVPANSIAQNLASGFKSSCPECNSHHGSDPNDCKGREPTKFRACPICRKKVFDNLGLHDEADLDDGDPNAIHDQTYTASTPETRTKAMLDLHIWTRHPQSARIMNLLPLPEPSQTLMEATTAIPEGQ